MPKPTLSEENLPNGIFNEINKVEIAGNMVSIKIYIK